MNNISWLISILLFIGIWIEITLNLGSLGLVIGWLPALTVSYLWLSITLDQKSKKGLHNCGKVPPV